MQMKLVDVHDNEMLLPPGCGLQEISPADLSLAMQNVLGRDGSVVEPQQSALGPKRVRIVGKLMDAKLINSGKLKEARAASLSAYLQIVGFFNNARLLGPVCIYRESGIVIDPAHPDYDAALAPLGYCLQGYAVGGTATPLWGGFGNAIIDLSIQLTCPRPFWQGHFSGAWSTGLVGDGHTLAAQFDVLGTVPASPQVVLYSAAGLSIPADKSITLKIGTLEVEWTGEIPAGSYVVFDCETGQVFLTAALLDGKKADWDGNPVTNKAPGLLNATDWATKKWRFSSGSHEVVVLSDMVNSTILTAHIRFANEYYG